MPSNTKRQSRRLVNSTPPAVRHWGRHLHGMTIPPAEDLSRGEHLLVTPAIRLAMAA